MKKKIYRVMVKIRSHGELTEDYFDAIYTGKWHSTKWEAEIELEKARKDYQIAWIEERDLEV